MKSELINISKAMKSSTSEVNKIDKKLTSSVSDLRNECGKLKESFLDIQMKSTSNNLIFYNIPEAETEVCWLKDNNLIEIDGFAKVSCVNRKQNIGVRSEGGIAVVCKNYIVDGIFVEKKFEYGIVIIKLDKLFFNSFDDTCICFAYIPHEKSNFCQICEHDFHDIIENFVLEYKSKGSVIVCGDLNSRTGELYDNLETDNLDRLIYGVESDDIPSISKGRSMDKVTNVFGRKLLQMCYNTGLTIANGGLGDDGDGKFTFCSSKGQSVNDYVLVFTENYNRVADFNVLQFNAFSDHAPIFCELRLYPRLLTNNFPKTHNIIKWDSSKSHEYNQLLLQHSESLLTLVNNLSSADDVNDAVREISCVLHDNAFKVFGKTILVNNYTNVKRHNNEWFNAKCALERRRFNSSRNLYQRHSTDANRQLHILARNSYNKAKRVARASFKRAKGLELCKIAKTNPRKF
ncbi:unnamed protein product [Mytilus coruscus]|uniref:Endonuclease/exonuclease/phosphatase domain-containing protein n=1 Tax=Mytilus coruscus TaxID=42192 RepID=A0A6J8ECX4_MYTCO|nr:unnamed protein product [Mytilus coruscus]